MFSTTAKTALTATFFALGVFASGACNSAETEACQQKFVSMLAPCVPKCEAEDPNGNASDECIRTCVQEEFGEPIPQC